MKNSSTLKETFRAMYLSKSMLNAVYMIAILILVVISFFSYQQVKNVIESDEWVSHTYEVIQKVNASLYRISNLESNQRAYLLTNNKRYIADLDEIKTDLQLNMQELKVLTKDNPGQNQRVLRFLALIDHRLEVIQQVLQLKALDKFNTPEGISLVMAGQDSSLRIRGLGEEIEAVEKVLLSERHLTVLKHADAVSIILIVGSIVSIFSLIGALLLTNRELIIRKISELQNKNTQAHLTKIIENVSDMVAAFDKDCRFIIFNEAYQREFKLIFGKLIYIGLPLKDVFAETNENQHAVDVWKDSLQEDNTFKTIELMINNEKQFYEISVNLIYNEKKEFNGAVQSVRNITKRIQAHTELQQSYEKLEQGMQSLQVKNNQITLLVEMSDIMLASNSQEELSDIMSKYSARLLNFASGFLYVMHPSKNYLEMISKWGTPTAQENTFTPEECWAIRLGRRNHISDHSYNELLCNHINLSDTEQDKYIYVCVPLMAQNDIYGLLYLEIKKGGEVTFDDNNKLLMNAFAELAALALANVRLRENLRHQSIRDPLTALYNRRYLEDYLFKQVHLAERTKSPFSVLMLDLDHFKKINDTFGHDAGDAVLKELGHILQDAIRIGDIAARYGGEEFVVAFYNMDHKTTLERAEVIRQAVLRVQVRYGAQQVGPTSASIGVAMYPEDGRTPTELIEAADKALYVAKHKGRNQIISFSEIKNDESS